MNESHRLTWIQRFKQLEILKIYFFSVFFYMLPVFSLGIFIIDQLTFHKTEMIFWVIFLVGMIPCGLIGLILSIIGLIASIKRAKKLNTLIGLIGTIAGLMFFGGGILGLMLIYVVVG